jgi:hypothetical protein
MPPLYNHTTNLKFNKVFRIQRMEGIEVGRMGRMVGRMGRTVGRTGRTVGRMGRTGRMVGQR